MFGGRLTFSCCGPSWGGASAESGGGVTWLTGIGVGVSVVGKEGKRSLTAVATSVEFKTVSAVVSLVEESCET